MRRETGDARRAAVGCRRGSALAAALALAFLIFAVATTSLLRIASSYTRITSRHLQTAALFAAEAGVRNAAARLALDRSYSGGSGGALPTGSFDVSVARDGDAFVVTSTGRSVSARMSGRKTVRATVRLAGDRSFRIDDWREDP